MNSFYNKLAHNSYTSFLEKVKTQSLKLVTFSVDSVYYLPIKNKMQNV